MSLPSNIHYSLFFIEFVSMRLFFISKIKIFIKTWHVLRNIESVETVMVQAIYRQHFKNKPLEIIWSVPIDRSNRYINTKTMHFE